MNRCLSLLASLLLLPFVVHAKDTHLIVAVGAEGAEEYLPTFKQWSANWAEAGKSGGAKQTIIGADPAQTGPDFPRLREAIEQTPRESTEPLWLVLLGHGTFNGREAKFNLRGDDVTVDQVAEWLKPFTRPVVIVCGFSASGAWLKTLSANGRVVLTSTRSGSEANYSRFAGHLSQVIASEEADLDKDGQTSLLEAWLAAARRTAEFYQGEGRLATEHSLLDDNGDAAGTPPDWFKGLRAVKRPAGKGEADGLRAHQTHLVRAGSERELSPEQRAERDGIERELTALRSRKSEMKEDEYFDSLEKLMLRLARIYRRGT
jgi:hypothetical protein